MPIFDFRCKECGNNFELLVLGPTAYECPQCGSSDVDKLVSLPAPKGKTAGIINSARAQAAREGHFSNYAPSERPKRK